jgi:hypothetical protein
MELRDLGKTMPTRALWTVPSAGLSADHIIHLPPNRPGVASSRW